MATEGNVAPEQGPIEVSAKGVVQETASGEGHVNKQLATKIVGGVGATLAFFAIVLFVATLVLRWRRVLASRRNALMKDNDPLSFDKKRAQRCSRMTISNSGKLLNETLSQTPKKHIHFLIYDLSLATNEFDEGNLLGEGGFGKVYRGVLRTPPFSKVAIKVLTGSSSQGVKEFITEIEVLSRLDHKHLVRLLGSCMVGEKLLLVYRHVANGSLSDHLHGENRTEKTIFTWPMRVKIALGAALGILHLHQQQPAVLHRDIKAANILLTRGFNAKVCDFGFAKQLSNSVDDHMRFCCTPSRSGTIGTLGYVAPESMMTGELSSASDVYSFGVVLLELLSGKKPLDFTKQDKVQSLVHWARVLLDQERISDLLDPAIPEDRSRIRDSVLLFLRMTRLCLDMESRARPTMGEIVQTLLTIKAEYESRYDAVVINLSDSDSSGEVSRSESHLSDNLDISEFDEFSKGFLEGEETDVEDFAKDLRRSSSSGIERFIGSRSWLSLGLNDKPSTPPRG